MNEKKVGCCTLCDTPVFEIVQRFDPPLSEPKAIGPPTDRAYKVSFVLMDGSIMYLTFCDLCTPTKFPEIWGKVLRSWGRELDDDYRELVGAKRMTKEQRQVNEAWLLGMVHQIPLGIIAVEKWLEEG